jgi:hypothetical protein
MCTAEWWNQPAVLPDLISQALERREHNQEYVYYVSHNTKMSIDVAVWSL